MRRFCCLLLCLLLTLSLVPARTEALEVSAAAAVLMDADTGEILFEKNADRRMLIASTTKILTALVVLEHARLDEVVTIQPRHMAEGSSMYLKPGETLTVETLLYGLLLCSGNDAAVGWMNETAQRIGMTGSSFANPNGLDDEQHYSTARDMALLAAYAARNPTFVRLCSTRSVTVGGRTMTNHNKLLQSVEGCIGMKTGYTRAAGRTLVSCARRGGRTLVAVTLQDGNDWADHAEMLSLPEKG